MAAGGTVPDGHAATAARATNEPTEDAADDRANRDEGDDAHQGTTAETDRGFSLLARTKGALCNGSLSCRSQSPSQIR